MENAEVSFQFCTEELELAVTLVLSTVVVQVWFRTGAEVCFQAKRSSKSKRLRLYELIPLDFKNLCSKRFVS